MKTLRGLFAPAVLGVLFAGLVGHTLLGANAAGAFAADGVKVGQEIKLHYVVGKKTVNARAILDADGTLRFAFPTEDGMDVAYVVYKLTRQDSGPNPPPPPVPVPTPDKITHLFLIHESADGTPAFTAIRNNATWKAEADKLGIKWIIVDDETAKAKIPKNVELAVKAGLPAVVMVDVKGLGVAEKCPSDPAAMLALVRKAGQKP